MSGLFFLGILGAFAIAAAGLCLAIALQLFRRIGECQAEAGDEDTLSPVAPRTSRGFYEK
jgi:hypothetical protein